MAKSSLEAELSALTEEFVARIVATLRNASFADVAALGPTRATSAPRRQSPPKTNGAGRKRRGAGERAEIADRIAETLRKAGEPLGARAIASALGVAPAKLAAPLQELRD